MPRDCKQGVINNLKESHAFQFAEVFDQDTSQDEVFATVAAPVVMNCLEGYNGTVFAYG